MNSLTVIAAGLGYRLLERNGKVRLAGIEFGAVKSVFPAVTCVAQASLRTGRAPAEHGLVSNGYWSETFRKPFFWEQSSRLVKGPRIWEKRRAEGKTVGLFFFQQSLGEAADVILSPAPIHKHGGGMILSSYTQPAELASEIERRCGRFPLARYWGPFASPKVGRACIRAFEVATEIRDVDEVYLYLPTLDYAAQAKGPDSPAARAALGEFERQLADLVALCERRGASLRVMGDYEITPVTEGPLLPNVLLRREGLFRTRTVGGMAYPDFYQTTAFAMCDHEFCVLQGPERSRAAELLLATGEYVRSPDSSLPDILLAKSGSWCGYEWWTSRREAPDYASHIDIHNKPGYDPKELFLFCRGTIRGTHGRVSEVAVSE